MHERGGVILLAQLSAPRGVRAYVDATIPGVAGVGISGVTIATMSGERGASPSCRLHGGVNTCTQPVEWCPMPEATWRLRVVKLSGPAGPLRVSFVVGPRPT